MERCHNMLLYDPIISIIMMALTLNVFLFIFLYVWLFGILAIISYHFSPVMTNMIPHILNRGVGREKEKKERQRDRQRQTD